MDEPQHDASIDNASHLVSHDLKVENNSNNNPNNNNNNNNTNTTNTNNTNTNHHHHQHQTIQNKTLMMSPSSPSDSILKHHQLSRQLHQLHHSIQLNQHHHPATLAHQPRDSSPSNQLHPSSPSSRLSSSKRKLSDPNLQLHHLPPASTTPISHPIREPSLNLALHPPSPSPSCPSPLTHSHNPSSSLEDHLTHSNHPSLLSPSPLPYLVLLTPSPHSSSSSSSSSSSPITTTTSPSSDSVASHPLSAPASRSHFDQSPQPLLHPSRPSIRPRSPLQSCLNPTLNHLPNKRPRHHLPSRLASSSLLSLPPITPPAPPRMRKLPDVSRPAQVLCLSPHKPFRASSLPPASPTKKRRKDDDVAAKSTTKAGLRASGPGPKISRGFRLRHDRRRLPAPPLDLHPFLASPLPNPPMTPHTTSPTSIPISHSGTTDVQPDLTSTSLSRSAASLPGVYRSRSAHEFSLPSPPTAPIYVQLIARHALDLPRINPVQSLTLGLSSTKSHASHNRTSKRLPGYSDYQLFTRPGSAPEINLPSWIPPITRSSMAELEFVEVLKNAQLRHDIVFDDVLRFRPNLDGDRGERKRLVADRYWLAISRELEANCRCAAFVQRFSDRRSISPSPDPRSLLGCVCSGGQFSQLSDTSAPPTIKPGTIPLDRIPSRIPPLVEELRNILLSLVAPRSPTLCPNSLTSETGSSSASAHELICATLDPAEISQRLERGRRIDMPALARFLGLVLKGHCAPMRDGIVDGMVSLISGEASEFVLEPDFQNAAHDSLQKSRYHGLAGGLRMSFELLELMKLDIANHQLRTLRPILLETALEFEIRHFRDQLVKRPSIDRTKRWYADALARVRARSPLTLSSSEEISRTVREGLLELVFNPHQLPTASTAASRAWVLPPIFPCSFSSASSHRSNPKPAALAASPAPIAIPETLSMDTLRLQTLHSDLADLTLAYLVLMLFKQLVGHSRLRPGDVENLKGELWVLMADPALKVKTEKVAHGSGSGTGRHAPGLGLKKLELPTWREAFRGVLLHVASRIQAIRDRCPTSSEESKTCIPSAELVKTVAGWMDSHIRLQSKLFQLSQTRLRQTLEAVVVEEMSIEPPGRVAGSIPATLRTGRATMMETEEQVSQRRRAGLAAAMLGRSQESSCSSLPSSSTSLPVTLDGIWTKNGLGELEQEIRLVGNRITKLLRYHLRGYGGLYAHLPIMTPDSS